MGIFSQHQFVLDLDCTQVRYKKKQQLRKAVTDNGGVISYILTKKTSFLVASNGAKTADSYKGRTARKQGVPIVGVGFLEKCVEEGCLLDQDDFLLVGTTANMEFGSGKITTTKTHQETKKPVKISFFNINKFKVWKWGSINLPAYLEDNYEVAKSVLLEKTEIGSQERSFYQLELHVIPDDVFDGTSTETHTDEVKYRFRVFIHRGDLRDMMNEDSGIREVMYCESSESAVELYSFLYNQRLKMKRSRRPASRWIGSPRYRQNQLAISGDCDGEMSPDVASLVESLWKEVIGELEDVLAVDIKTLSAEKVTKAESILLQIKKALDAEDTDESGSKSAIEELSQEFYSQIPHKMHHKEDFKTKSVIAKKQDLCQLIKDIVSVSETTNWSKRSSVESKYRALRCHISCLLANHPEYHDVKNVILSTQGKIWPVKILNIFAVTRPLELTSYNAKLHNSQLLFHASRPANFVGILSRGLVLPKVVVDDFGGERTDAGMLGSGIYFADSFCTSAKYSHTSQTTGTRLMAVNQVALGNCHDTTIYQKDLLKPPDGFHSVHGVKRNGTNHSDFKDDEYVVYNTNQQRLRYLIEFLLPDDKPTMFPVCDNKDTKDVVEDVDVDYIKEELSAAIDLSDVQSVENPLTKIKPGLLSNADQPIPLKAVHVRARLLDLAAQVVVLQVYANDSDIPIEAKYVFPLDEQAAVCGFEAFINDKHIVGEVKEKETAHREYKEAISQGHGAYLMDEEKPDVFTVSVGNLPPNTTVVIKITYVAELAVEGDKILFTLPGSVAPWRKDEALAQETQTDVETVKVNSDTKRSLSVHVNVEMPYDIRSLESPTHPIKQKQTATKATVCLSENCSGLDDGFQLLIGLAEIHVPRMWAERHPTEKDSQACMLTFYPEFDANSSGQSEVVILLDLSNSMRGESNLQDAKKLVMLILHHLTKDCKFNIVVFGTDFEELFPQSKVMNKETMKTAQGFLQGLSATMGNTDVWRPLKAYFMLKSGQLRNVFFISDGHVSNEEATLETVRKNCRHTRVFTFGVSATANKYLLRAVANTGAGAFEYFDNKTKSKWEGKVQSQLSRASQPVLSSVNVKWCQFDDDAPTPIQAPNHITSLFSGSRQVVYGFVPYCTQATLTATIDGKEVSTMVSTHDLSITQGKILHQLTARNIIRDWEEGSLATDHTRHEARKAEQKTYIISLSKKYSIVTQFTSFVAVEVRDETEGGKVSSGVNITDLLQKEAVDSLTYLDWQHHQSQDAPEEIETQEECIEGHGILQDDDEWNRSYSSLSVEYADYLEIGESSEDEQNDDDYEVLTQDMKEDNTRYGEISAAISRSIEEESESDDDMGFRLGDDDQAEYDEVPEEAEYDEVPEEAEYDEVPVEAEQERSRNRDGYSSLGGYYSLGGFATSIYGKGMNVHLRKSIRKSYGLSTQRTIADSPMMEKTNKEVAEQFMHSNCAGQPMVEQQQQQQQQISGELESYSMMSSIQPEVTSDKKVKKKKKAGLTCDGDLTTYSKQATEVQQEPRTKSAGLECSRSDASRFKRHEVSPFLKSARKMMSEDISDEKFEKQMEDSNEKKKEPASFEASFCSLEGSEAESYHSVPSPTSAQTLDEDYEEDYMCAEPQRAMLIRATAPPLPHTASPFLKSVRKMMSEDISDEKFEKPIIDYMCAEPQRAMLIRATAPPLPHTGTATSGERQQPADSATGLTEAGIHKPFAFGVPSPPHSPPTKSTTFGEVESHMMGVSYGGPLPWLSLPQVGLSKTTTEKAESFWKPELQIHRRRDFSITQGMSSLIGRGGPSIDADLFGGASLPQTAKQTQSSTFGGLIGSSQQADSLKGLPPPPPPGTGSFGFGGVSSSEKGGLFGGPPPPPPPPGTGSFGFGGVSSSEKGGLFGGPPPPPPPGTGSFGFGGVSSSEKGGLFGGPPPPPPPPGTGSFGFGGVSSSEKGGLFGGPPPPPPPPGTGSFGFGGVSSSEKGGLFGGPPPPPPPGTGSFGFGGVSSSEKGGLFGGPPPPPPPSRSGSVRFGGVTCSSSEKGGLFGGPPPPPPPSRSGSVRFGGVTCSSSEKGGLFGGPPPPPPATGSFRFGGVSSSEKAGLFGVPSPPPPPSGSCSMGFGGVGSSANAGLFGGPTSQEQTVSHYHAFCDSQIESPPASQISNVRPKLKGSLPSPPQPLQLRSPSYSPTSPGSYNSLIPEDLGIGIGGGVNLKAEMRRSSSTEVSSINQSGQPQKVCVPISKSARSPLPMKSRSSEVPQTMMAELTPQLRARGVSQGQRSLGKFATLAMLAREKSASRRADTSTTSLTRHSKSCISRGLNIETIIRTSDGETNIRTVMIFLEHQNKAGWWSLGPVFQAIVGVNCAYISKMLIDAGVKSLGTDVAQVLEQLVTTYLVILHLNKILKLSPTPCISSRDRESTVEAVLKAERWVTQVEKDHPSMARRLELGSSWDERHKEFNSALTQSKDELSSAD